MSIARHHTEWLSLIEISGPFLSVPVLMKAFPQGLHPHDSEHSRTLKLAYEEWTEAANDSSLHWAWIRYVLQNTLGLEDQVLAEGQAIPQTLRCDLLQYGETLRPDLIVTDPLSGKPRLLIKIYPQSQNLCKHVEGSRWNKSPDTVMSTLLRSVGVRLGLVTNGERWMLVDTPQDETTGYASWYTQLWFEEPITLRAFRSLVSVDRFFEVPEGETLESLFARSTEDQQEVTNQLGLQVRKAVEVLIQALDKADLDLNRILLADIGEKQLYEAALTIMMRLVFLFCAEERGLLHLGDDIYDRFYAVSTLREQLRSTADQHGEEILEMRCDSWVRLLTTFRVVHAGIRHDRLSVPAYGGHLFDPDRFPFLEGRAFGSNWRESSATPLPVNNRTVLHLLEALQILRIKLPGGGPAETRKLSFLSLGVEQIGYVYEGLLDHTAKRAYEPVLGLQGSKDKEPEVALSELEGLIAKGEKHFLDFLKDETGRSPAALKKSWTTKLEGEDLSQLRTACQGDEALLKRVLPFASLIRLDPYGYRYVVPEGGVYVTSGTDRRSSGTHYTPPSLTEPIVQHTLDPLIYPEMAEGKSKETSRRLTIEEILNLKICDMAMGSAAFLVQVIRFLAGEIVQRWADAENLARERGEALPVLTAPYADPATGTVGEQPIPADETERMILAKRLVAERCVYGVDINPMAVEIAKLSIWLETMAKDRPFTFIDHALCCGDSLLGIADSRQIETFHINPERGEIINHAFIDRLSSNFCRRLLKQALDLRSKLESFTVQDPRDAHRKEALLHQAEEALENVKLIGDLLVGAAMVVGSDGDKLNDLILGAMDDVFLALDEAFADIDRIPKLASLRAKALSWINPQSNSGLPTRRTFNWVIEFPEVLAGLDNRPIGFDAIVGNPPFVGGQKITGILGIDYRNYLVSLLAKGQRGSADLSAYFFLRAGSLLKRGGTFGLLATNTIAQGDTREIGLEQLIPKKGIDESKTPSSVYRAVPSRKWPGQANLQVAEVWFYKGTWNGPFILEDKQVCGITSFLVPPGKITGNPRRLKANEDKSFIGSYVLGMGFILSPEEAQDLILRNAKNRDVLFPYINGEDLNSRPDQSPSRWVINFHDWPLDRSADGSWAKNVASGSKEAKKRIKAWLQSGRVPADYPEPVASDYPDCLQIVEEKVKPERIRKKNNGEFTLRYPLYLKWWIYGEKRPALYSTIAGMERVLVLCRVTKYLSITSLPGGWVYSIETAIFSIRPQILGILQCSIYEAWVREYSSTLETRLRYSPSDCFETFPFPDRLLESSQGEFADLESVGERYHEHRCRIMQDRDEGLTAIYNRFHNPGETDPAIETLRNLHVEMDQAVTAAYRWTDPNLGHGFHQTKQGLRYTVSPSARQEILDRLLELNHACYADEVRRGLHEKKGSASKTRVNSDSVTGKLPMFDEEDE